MTLIVMKTLERVYKNYYFIIREVIDMCKAWEDQKNEGRELGERQKIISLVVKKLQKDKSVAEIADDLEEKEEVIAPIYEAALSMKPDYDVEKIYELLEKNKKLA